MGLESTKVWLVSAGGLIGAIAGGSIWANRAAGVAATKAQQAGEDALIQTAQTVGMASLAAVIQGALVGAVLGVIAVAAYLHFTDPDREMVIKKVETGDNNY